MERGEGFEKPDETGPTRDSGGVNDVSVVSVKSERETREKKKRGQ